MTVDLPEEADMEKLFTKPIKEGSMSDYDVDIPALERTLGWAAAPPRCRRAGQRCRGGPAEHRRGDRGRGTQPVGSLQGKLYVS
jgi:hypothetical protein